MNRRHAQPHRRGAAMSEMVLALPLLVVILSLMFFFGRGYVRLQSATGMDRYAVWREVAEAPGPRRTAQLNDLFFAGRAAEIERESDRFFPDAAPQALVRASEATYPDAEPYGDVLFDQLPAGVRFHGRTTHTEENALWRQIDGPINHTHTRLGNDWRFRNSLRLQDDGLSWRPGGSSVANTRVLRDVFLTDLDGRLEVEANRGVGLAATLRGFYLRQPGYAGPELPQRWLRGPGEGGP